MTLVRTGPDCQAENDRLGYFQSTDVFSLQCHGQTGVASAPTRRVRAIREPVEFLSISKKVTSKSHCPNREQAQSEDWACGKRYTICWFSCLLYSCFRTAEPNSHGSRGSRCFLSTQSGSYRMRRWNRTRCTPASSRPGSHRSTSRCW
jgi:hypothetical protein